MRRVRIALGMTLCVLVSVGSARAGWHEFWHRVNLDYHRMNAYPKPFTLADRRVTRAPLAVIADNGWRLQNTLGDHFFNSETQELTHAGFLKVRRIVLERPPLRRTVFVLYGHDPKASEIRRDSVQRAVTRIVPEGALPPVVMSRVTPRGAPGDYFDRVDSQWKDSIPEPRLPEAEGGMGIDQ